MQAAKSFRIVLVTAPDLKTARSLARRALGAGLIACANLIPQVESLYRWQGRLEQSSEVLLVMKARSTHVRELERLILEAHPYDTPEFLILPLAGGSTGYLTWLRDSTGASQKPLRKSPDKKFRGSRPGRK